MRERVTRSTTADMVLDGSVRLRRLTETPLVEVLRWTCVRDSAALREPRNHEDWVLTVLLGGSTWVETDRWSGLIDPGLFVLHPPGTRYRTTHPHGLGDHGFNLRLHAGLVEPLLGNLSRSSWTTDAIRVSAPAPALLLAARLLAALVAPPTRDRLLVEQTASDLVASTLVRGPSKTRFAAGETATCATHAEIAERAKAFLASHYAEPIGLADVARAAHASPSHLNRVFRSAVGCSVYQYVRRRRIGAALDRIIETDAPLSSIALDVGFSSHSHLTTTIREALGVTPVRLRDRRHRTQLLRELGARPGRSRPRPG